MKPFTAICLYMTMLLEVTNFPHVLTDNANTRQSGVQQYCSNDKETCGNPTLSCTDGRTVKITDVVYRATYWCRVCVRGHGCFCRQDVHHPDSNLTRRIMDLCDNVHNCSFSDLYSEGTVVVYFYCRDNTTEVKSSTATIDGLQEHTSQTTLTASHEVSECATNDTCRNDTSVAVAVFIVPVVIVVVIAVVITIALIIYMKRRRSRMVRWERITRSEPMFKTLERNLHNTRNRNSETEGNIYTIPGTEISPSSNALDCSKSQQSYRATDSVLETLKNERMSVSSLLETGTESVSSYRRNILSETSASDLDSYHSLECLANPGQFQSSRLPLVTFKSDVLRGRSNTIWSVTEDKVSSGNTDRTRNFSAVSGSGTGSSVSNETKVTRNSLSIIKHNSRTTGDTQLPNGKQKTKTNKRVTFVL